MAWDIDIDAIGLRCPLPVLRLRKALQDLSPGQVARLRASDAMAQIDVPHFCTEQGHVLRETAEMDGAFVFLVEKGV